MINKQLLMNSFKLKTLNMMSTENRVALGITKENENQWNKTILPEKLKDIIDNVYKNLNEIAQENSISTESVNQLIEGKRAETNIKAQSLYKKKTVEQMNKLQVELAKIKDAIESDRMKFEEQKANIEENTKDEKNNSLIAESLYKNIVTSVQSIQNRMSVELLGKMENPIEAQRKIQKITTEIIYSVKRANLQQNISQTLNIDDKMIASKINGELENTMTYMNKTDRERFVDSVKIEDTPKIPKDFFEKKEEEKENEYKLDPNIIE